MISKKKYLEAKKIFLNLIDLSSSKRSTKIHQIKDNEVKKEVQELLQNHVKEFTISVRRSNEISPVERPQDRKNYLFWNKWIRNKYQLAITLSFLILIVIGIGVFSHFSVKKTILEQKQNELINISLSNELALNNWIEDREEFISLIRNSKIVDKALQSSINYFKKYKIPNKEVNDSIIEKLFPILRADNVRFFHLTSQSGKVILTNEKEINVKQLKSYQLAQILPTYDTKKILFIPPTKLDLNLKTSSNVPTIWVCAPISNGKKTVAVLSFGYYADDGFSNILQSQKAGGTGESIGFNKTGIQISHSKNDTNIVKKCLNRVLRSPQKGLSYDTSPVSPPIAQALSPSSPKYAVTLNPYKNSDNIEVIGAYIWLKKHQFGVLTEIPIAEAFLPIKKVHFIFYIICAVVFILLFINITILISSYKQRNALEKENYIGPYKVLDKIGEGGIGSVYLSEHKLLKRPTAIKTLKTNFNTPINIERFEREVLLTCKLTHPNTIKIYDYGKAKNGQFYFAMELLKGITLNQLIDAAGELPINRAVNILLQLCYSLKEAHHNGLIHRDIKPQNIMVCYVGDMYDFVKVLDFGLVKDLKNKNTEEMTTLFEIGGTPMYMSPERLTAPEKVDYRSDIYAIGVIAYYLLTGKKPFLNGITDIDLINNVLHEKPREINDIQIPSKLKNVIMRCLAKKPEDRPDSLLELIEALEQFNHASWNQNLAKEWWQKNLIKLLDINE